ncbi:MAG: efflux RND transporter periplasmic adaptor subunit, partial [Bacteroidota bacterium]
MKTTDMRILPFYLALLFLAACSGGKEAAETAPAEAPATEELIAISDEQAGLIGIETGRPDMRVISNNIKASGMLDVPPQNMVTINAPLGGFVHETHLLQGTRVKKGEVVVTMRHPDYIQLQQDYLENRSQLEYMEADLKRQEELSRENISAQKTVQLARAEYGKTKARYLGLEAKLRMIDLSGEDVAKNGIRETIGITSP